MTRSREISVASAAGIFSSTMAKARAWSHGALAARAGTRPCPSSRISPMASPEVRARRPSDRKVTTRALRRMKEGGERISALTAYDYLTAELLDAAGVDVLLVGDSAAMVVQGLHTTVSVTMEQMLYHAEVVSRGVERALVVADLPFMSYQVRATEPEEADEVRRGARALQDAGAFAIVLEKIPATLAAEISQGLAIPTLGIGAGSGCDGQILVTPDMLGLYTRFQPRFVRRYAELGQIMRGAFERFVHDVKAGDFPSEDESY